MQASNPSRTRVFSILFNTHVKHISSFSYKKNTFWVVQLAWTLNLFSPFLEHLYPLDPGQMGNDKAVIPSTKLELLFTCFPLVPQVKHSLKWATSSKR